MLTGEAEVVQADILYDCGQRYWEGRGREREREKRGGEGEWRGDGGQRWTGFSIVVLGSMYVVCCCQFPVCPVRCVFLLVWIRWVVICEEDGIMCDCICLEFGTALC